MFNNFTSVKYHIVLRSVRAITKNYKECRTHPKLSFLLKRIGKTKMGETTNLMLNNANNLPSSLSISDKVINGYLSFKCASPNTRSPVLLMQKHKERLRRFLSTISVICIFISNQLTAFHITLYVWHMRILLYIRLRSWIIYPKTHKKTVVEKNKCPSLQKFYCFLSSSQVVRFSLSFSRSHHNLHAYMYMCMCI